jgi:hypothetical protein
MREIRYFGLNQWAEMREAIHKLMERQRTDQVSNITCRGDVRNIQYVLEWDEELIDLENK